MRNTLTEQEVNDLRQSAVRDWQNLKPGVYQKVYAYNGLNTYEWIAIFGITPSEKYSYTSLSDDTLRHGYAPIVLEASLADAGVLRDKNGYLGKNFLVPIDEVKEY